MFRLRMHCFAIGFLLTATASAAVHPAERPNILMIMVDDLGFSDLGCYGSEIETPNLDALAAGGIRFSQFYNTAKCHSSRVSLLTGQYCMAAGNTSLQHAVTTAEVLRSSGYFTAMTGKWHLKQQPTDFGFDRYFGHLSGACNYFRGDKTFQLNGQSWTVPEQGFYTTVANIDFGLEFLKEARESGKPWHLYIAFNAPHAPLQALPEDYAKYEGRFDAGWDRVREARVARQKTLGLLPEESRPSPRPDHIPAWNSLSEARISFENKRMTALAAMIDRVDQELGRLIEDLKAAGEFENTLIWFVSDNGACPYDRRSSQIDLLPINGDVTWSDSTGWAWARNSPFRYYKQNQFEGGICTPAIVHWPAGLNCKSGSIVRTPAHLIDIMPTFADVAGATIPVIFPGRDVRPVSGQSLRSILEGGSLDRQQPLHFLFGSDRGLRDGDWKAVSFRSGPWELYNLRDDRTELHDRSSEEPQRLQAMIERWTTMARETLHANRGTFAPVRDEPVPYHPEWTDFSRDPADGLTASSKGRDQAPSSKQQRAVGSIRARKNTQLKVNDDQLELTFTGEDPGLAFDNLPSELPKGPYLLTFELNSEAVGDGEVFFTTDAITSLPKGTQFPFSVQTYGEWHKYSVEIPTDQRLHKLRLDVSEGEGRARIRSLRLMTASEDLLLSWPE